MKVGACSYCGGGPLTADHECFQMRIAKEIKKREADKQQITENYFRALGWILAGDGSFEWWVDANKKKFTSIRPLSGNLKDITRDLLPDIIDHFPSFKKWVIEEMERRVPNCQLRIGVIFVWWGSDNFSSPTVKPNDNEILSAAVISATRYLEGEDAKGSQG